MSEDNSVENGDVFQMKQLKQEYDQQLMERCEQFCMRLRRNNQHIYKQFSNIVCPGTKNAKDLLGDLLSEDPELLRDVNLLLEEEVKFKSQKERISEYFQKENNKNKALDTILKMIQSGQIDGQSNREYISDLFESEPQLQQQFVQSFKKKNEGKNSNVVKIQENRNYFQKLLEKCTSVEMKNDLIFWDRFRNRAIQQFPDEYQQFMAEFLKMVFLYSECVITQIEFMELLNQQDWLEKEFIDEIRIMVNSRIITRRIQTPYFKPLKDTDFTASERLTRSYVRMPNGYARASTGTVLQNQILNHNWVSVPFGSEDQSFLIMRKNTFEEQLFKSEDERYEFDFNILQIKRTIKLLEQQQSQSIDDPIHLAKIVDMRILQQLYRNQNQDQNEIIQIFLQRPQESAKILLKRLKQKLLELTQGRNTKAKAIWENVSQLNFHRSLDHRSFYFKKNDKLVVNGQRFVREIEEQAKNVLIKHLGSKEQIFIKRKPDLIAFTFEGGFLNSLSQLTNIKPFIPQNNPLPDITDENIRNFPLMFLWLGNEQILQECAQFVIHYFQIMGGNTLSDRRTATNYLIKMINILCQTPMQPMQINELCLSDLDLKNQIQELEVYDIIYNPQEIQVTIPTIQPQHPKSLIQLLPNTYTTIFATQNLYVLLRFIHALYQRMEIAWIISKQNKGNLKRYNLFKSALFLSLKAKEFKYEDYLRSLFGKHGFIFSTLEKVLHDAAKQIQVCIQDNCTLNLFENVIAQQDGFDKFFHTVTGIANGEAIKVEDLKTQISYKFIYYQDELALLNLHEQLLLNKQEKKPLYRIAFWHKVSFISLLPAHGSIGEEQPRMIQLPFLRRNLKVGTRRVQVQNEIQWLVDESSHIKPIQGEDYLQWNQ